MDMENRDKDWLDDRLVSAAYLPDDGFTVRVIAQLPKANRAYALGIRGYILLISSVICLALVAILIGPLVATLLQVASHYSATEETGRFVGLLRQPLAVYGAEAVSVVGTIIALPFLRRWV
jgi:hypothetical protein